MAAGAGRSPTPTAAGQPVGPSAPAVPGLRDDPAPLTVDEIAAIVAAFAAAAGRADAPASTCVEMHAAHGYLLHEFLSPLSNQRTTSTAARFENRMRLLLEVVDAVRGAVPDDMPLFVRLSATDWVEGGWSVDDSVRLAGQLREPASTWSTSPPAASSPAHRSRSVPATRCRSPARVREEAASRPARSA